MALSILLPLCTLFPAPAIAASYLLEKPDYNSGWVSLAQGETKMLQHGLGGDVDSYVVDMTYYLADSIRINAKHWAGMDYGAKAPTPFADGDRVAAFWEALDGQSVSLTRREEDPIAPLMRLRIWADPGADYDSGWRGLAAGAQEVLTHNLGGDAEDLVVYLEQRSGDLKPGARFMGGNVLGSRAGPDDGLWTGLDWRTLTAAQVTVHRWDGDGLAPQYRLRIWGRPRPAYDCQFLPVPQNTPRGVLHALGGNSNDYVVIHDQKSDGLGINAIGLGGMDAPAGTPPYGDGDRLGSYWDNLDERIIVLARQPQDIFAPFIRARIYIPRGSGGPWQLLLE